MIHLIHRFRRLIPFNPSLPKPANKNQKTRRAVLVCMHPLLGLTVLDREGLFRRKLRPDSDECSAQAKQLIAVAALLLQKHFKHQYDGFVRGGMFTLSKCGTECTVFFFELKSASGYSLIPIKAFKKLSSFPEGFAAAIAEAVSKIDVLHIEQQSRKHKGLG